MKQESIIKEKQQPLITRYKKDPATAMITDVAFIEGHDLDDPFHTTVSINDELQVPFRIGVHRGVGGLHDHPNPGDLLCASLASCFESTMRLIANRLQIELLHTRVKATARVDLRGTLMVDRDTPVNFQSMHLRVEIKTKDTDPEVVQRLITGTEKCCIIYQTISLGIPVEIDTTVL